jgi:gluconate 2-dehydrogenase gamma chain
MLHEIASRRAFLSGTSAALATLWFSADPTEVRAALEHSLRAAGTHGQAALTVLTPEQAADVEALAEQIFPTTDTPGAREARVVDFVDASLDGWAARQREATLGGLEAFNAEVEQRWPGSGRFARLPPERQTAFLKDHEKHPFFDAIRTLTLLGMFALPSYGGNADQAGWRLIGFEDRYAWQPPFGAYDGEAAGPGGGR